LAVVGIAENVFSITASIGAILMLNPFTHAAGEVMFSIGTKGVIYCGLTKTVINMANGNWTGALMALGQTAITAAASMVGAGAAANSVLSAVSNGLSVVASSAEMVNNVRTLQGKEASGIASIIGTVAGVASAAASVGAGFMSSKEFVKDAAGNIMKGATGKALTNTVKSSFAQAGTFGKVAQIA